MLSLRPLLFGVGLLAGAALGRAVEPASAQPAPPPPVEVLGRAAAVLLGGPEATAGRVDAACAARVDPGLRAGAVVLPIVDFADLATAAGPVGEGRVAGVIMLGTPTASPAPDLAALIAAAAPTGVAPFLAVDEEGGTVQRLKDVLGAVPGARTLAEQDTPEQVTALLAEHARAVADLGFSTGLAPVLDVGSGPAIGRRSYGDDAATVTTYGLAAADGIREGGLLPVVKHFPGHGHADADSHEAPATTPPLEEMRASDLLPFEAAVAENAAGHPVAVMVGHLDVPGLTDGVPATLSPAAVQGLLRDEMGFDGLVMTDALSMGAVSVHWTQSEAAVLALAAGVDLAMTDSLEAAEAARLAVIEAVAAGTLPGARLDEAAAHSWRARGAVPCALG